MPVSLTLDRQTIFNTSFGGWFSILCTMIIIFYTGMKIVEMLPAGSGTETSMTENFFDRNEEFDLHKLNFVFGIEEINPALGRIEAYAVSQPQYRLKDEQRIDLVSCKDLIDSADEMHEDIYRQLVRA